MKQPMDTELSYHHKWHTFNGSPFTHSDVTQVMCVYTWILTAMHSTES